MISYGNSLEMLNDLKPNRVLSFQEQVDIFSYRFEMNELSLNYIQGNKKCICTEELNNAHLFQCNILNNNHYPEQKYEYILNGTLHQKKNILKIMEKNTKSFKEKFPGHPEPTIN